MVRVENAVGSGNGKNIKYGVVEFDDIIKEFGPEHQKNVSRILI